MTAYNEEWVMSRRNANHGLKPIETVLKAHGNPQNQLKVIHVAGTNGKGSTCSYLKDILVSQGFRVGMFTSPHLITHRDRIRINDTYISEAQFQSYLQLFLQEILDYQLGMFEIDTCIAYSWFLDEKVDYAIMECGLGGRLDSTNVIDEPVLSLITSIGNDHTEILGSRKQQIAFEKAGIIQPYTPCITSVLDVQAFQVIQKYAHRYHARVIQNKPVIHCEKNGFRFMGDQYVLSTSAQYQCSNASLALRAAQFLGIDIHSKKVHEVLAKSMWKGRFETVSDSPRIILDGAHNAEGMHALTESMRQLSHPVVTVFSALKDKPTHLMAQELLKVSDQLIITHFENKRSDTFEHLLIPHAIGISNYEEAIRKAVGLARDNGTVVVTGSLYFISTVRAYLLQNNH